MRASKLSGGSARESNPPTLLVTRHNGFGYVVVNRQVKGDIIVRRETDGEWATLRPTDRVVRTAKSRMRDYMPSAMALRQTG